GAAGRDQLDPVAGKRAGEIDQPGLVGDGDEGAFYRAEVGHFWSFRGAQTRMSAARPESITTTLSSSAMAVQPTEVCGYGFRAPASRAPEWRGARSYSGNSGSSRWVRPRAGSWAS